MPRFDGRTRTMALGRFLFPALMAGFVAFLFVFLLTTPVTPAPEVPDSKLPRAKLGDSVIAEVTAYYELDGQRFVWFSTQQERRAELPVGPIAPQFQDDPASVALEADSVANATGLTKALLGRKAGDRFTVGPVEPKDLIGDWERVRTMPREFAAYPYSIRLDGDFELAPGQYFNVTEYLNYWRTQGFSLQLNSEWPCEGELWDCRVTTLDMAGNVLVYRRLVADGTSFPITSLVGAGTLGGNDDWNFTIIAKGESFAVRLDPPVGTVFVLRADLRPPFDHGTYRVTGLGATTFDADYSSATPGDARLIGLTTYFDFEILRIQSVG